MLELKRKVKNEMKKTRQIIEKPEMTEEGLRNTLATLLQTQRFIDPKGTSFLTGGCVCLYLEKEVEDPMDIEHAGRYLSEAKKRGYVEGAVIYTKIGKNPAMHFGYRINKNKLPEIEKFLE